MSDYVWITTEIDGSRRAWFQRYMLIHHFTVNPDRLEYVERFTTGAEPCDVSAQVFKEIRGVPS